MAGTTALNHDVAAPILPGVLAAATFVVTAVGYFVTPVNKLSSATRINYILLLATTTTLTAQTGGASSAFVGLLVALLPFGAILGSVGFGVSFLLFVGFVAQQYAIDELAGSQLVALAFLGGISLLGGAVLWGRTETSQSDETPEDRDYHDLASELNQVSSKSEVVIGAIGDGVVALDNQGTIQLINPAAQRLLGWGKRDANNLSYKSVLKMLDSKNQPVAEMNDPVSQAINTNTPQKNDSFSLQTQSGKNFLASISVSPVGQAGSGVIVVFRDITAEKSDERQRAEFISTASHEMRTPVASIEGYLGLALNPATAQIDDKARDFITKAHESAQHLGRLFADLLDVSKADDSRLSNNPKIVDIVPFVHDIVEGLTPKAAEKGLRVIYKPVPDDGAVEDPVKRLNPVFYANVDNDHLREVVQNLVENGIKYTLKGEVAVDVTGDQKHIVISIADTGLGIPREDLDHLFQKFYRVDTSETREIGGTGLGLYLCRRLTETMGGRIWVESEYGQGSTFYIEIPRTDHEEAQRLLAQLPPTPHHDTAQTSGVQVADAPAHTQPQPVPAPTPPPTPAEPVAAPRPPTTPNQNTPLSAIEANPSQYLTRREPPTMNIPQR